MKHQRPYRILSPPSTMKTSSCTTHSPPSTATAPPYRQDPLPDDLVPLLPPDWKPQSYCQETLSPQPASFDEAVIHV